MAFTKEQKEHLDELAKNIQKSHSAFTKEDLNRSRKAFKDQVKRRMLIEDSYPVDIEFYLRVLIYLVALLNLIIIFK